MLTEVCAWLRNHFEREVYREKVIISGGNITGFDDRLFDGQYFRIQGSVLNDGVHLYPAYWLNDETFYGTITSMAVPKAVVDIVDEIELWQKKYGTADALSPFSSEELRADGYSYTRKDSTSQGSDTWQAAFSSRLSPWRKLK